jgi:hypothetical protein
VSREGFRLWRSATTQRGHREDYAEVVPRGDEAVLQDCRTALSLVYTGRIRKNRWTMLKRGGVAGRPVSTIYYDSPFYSRCLSRRSVYRTQCVDPSTATFERT